MNNRQEVDCWDDNEVDIGEFDKLHILFHFYYDIYNTETRHKSIYLSHA